MHTEFVDSLEALAMHADYLLLDTLLPDSEATKDGNDREPRQVFRDHLRAGYTYAYSRSRLCCTQQAVFQRAWFVGCAGNFRALYADVWRRSYRAPAPMRLYG